jgi:hypothetical protein
MARTVVMPGHVVGNTTVEVDAPIPKGTTRVEVILHLAEAASEGRTSVAEYLRSLPAGTRTKKDIDRQIEEERGAWRD